MYFKRDEDRNEFFEKNVFPNVKKLEHYAIKVLGSLCDAQDIVQDVLADAWEKAESLEQPEKIFYWLSSCVRHKCLNYIKSRKLEKQLYEKSLRATPDTMEDTLEILVAKCNYIMLEKALKRLHKKFLEEI